MKYKSQSAELGLKVLAPAPAVRRRSDREKLAESDRKCNGNKDRLALVASVAESEESYAEWIASRSFAASWVRLVSSAP